jgi:hypothetical protein
LIARKIAIAPVIGIVPVSPKNAENRRAGDEVSRTALCLFSDIKDYTRQNAFFHNETRKNKINQADLCRASAYNATTRLDAAGKASDVSLRGPGDFSTSVMKAKSIPPPVAERRACGATHLM